MTSTATWTMLCTTATLTRLSSRIWPGRCGLCIPHSNVSFLACSGGGKGKEGCLPYCNISGFSLDLRGKFYWLGLLNTTMTFFLQVWLIFKASQSNLSFNNASEKWTTNQSFLGETLDEARVKTPRIGNQSNLFCHQRWLGFHTPLLLEREAVSQWSQGGSPPSTPEWRTLSQRLRDSSVQTVWATVPPEHRRPGCWPNWNQADRKRQPSGQAFHPGEIPINQLIKKGWVGRGFYDQICLGENGLKKIHFLTAELFRLLNFSQAFRLSNYGIEQGSANIFCQGPDGKYFRPCKSNGLHYNKLILLLWQQSCYKTMDNMQCVWLCSNKTLFIKTSKGQDSAFRP